MFVVLAGLFQSGEGPLLYVFKQRGAATWGLAGARKLLDCRVASLLAMTMGKWIAASLRSSWRTEGETDCRVVALARHFSQ